MQEVTADTILEYFSTAVENRKQLNPEFWLDSALKLNILMIDEEKKLQDLRRAVADLKLRYLDEMQKKSVAEAELRVEATSEYSAMRQQESRCARMEEFIRLAKLSSRTAQGM
jgi:hypothetical protein